MDYSTSNFNAAGCVSIQMGRLVGLVRIPGPKGFLGAVVLRAPVVPGASLLGAYGVPGARRLRGKMTFYSRDNIKIVQIMQITKSEKQHHHDEQTFWKQPIYPTLLHDLELLANFMD